MEEQNQLLGQSADAVPGLLKKTVTFDVTEKPTLYEIEQPENVINTTRPSDDGLTPASRFVQRLLSNALVRYSIYVVPVAGLLIIPVVLYANKAEDQRSIGGVDGLGLFIYVEILWVWLWISRLIGMVIPALFQLFGSLFSKMIKKYAIFLKATEIPLSLFIWTGAALAFFPIISIFSKEGWTAQMAKIPSLHTFYDFVRASIGIAALFLIEKLAMQAIAISYHGKQYREKIGIVRATTKALELLYEASLKKYPDHCPDLIDEDIIIHDFNSVQELLKRNSVHHSLRRLYGEFHFFGEHIISALGRMARDISGSKAAMDLTATHAVVEGALGRRVGATALANRIFKAMKSEDKDFLTKQDIAHAFEGANEDDTKWIFSCLDHDNNGDVSLEELVRVTTDLHQTRKDMWQNSINIKDAIHVLDRVLSFILLLLAIFIYTAVFSDWVAANAGLFGTALAAPAFALSQTAGEFIGACILVFIKHPYDVGDRVVVNSIEYQVVRISLLYTVSRTISGGTISQISNSEITKFWIDNVSRSGAMKERYQFSICAGTSFREIEMLRVEMENFVRAEENKRDYTPQMYMQLLSIGDMKQLDLRVEINFKSNWSDEKLRAYRRSKFMCGLLSAMRKVNIDPPGGSGPTAGSIDAPTYSVTVTEEAAKAAKEAWAENKKAARTTEVEVSETPSTVSSGLEILPTLLSRHLFVQESKRRSIFGSVTKRNR